MPKAIQPSWKNHKNSNVKFWTYLARGALLLPTQTDALRCLDWSQSGWYSVVNPAIINCIILIVSFWGFVLFYFVMAGISLPEGVDPSFLAALPEDIRREVLQNQLGIRPPSRPPAATSLPSSTAPVLGGPGVTEVSPEFLAALPPAIQEEVRSYVFFFFFNCVSKQNAYS